LLIKMPVIQYNLHMQKEPFSRLDGDNPVREKLLGCCRLQPGDIWKDPEGKHKVGLLDCTNPGDIDKLFGTSKAVCAIHDPPYNIAVGNHNTPQLSQINIDTYLDFSVKWVSLCENRLAENSHLYVWLGADQTRGFQPLADFMIGMRNFGMLKSRSFITLRNQRGYGTQKNWMCARQELLYYTKGKPGFRVMYTDIPKVLKGYYKTINGKITENIERSKSETIRPGNIWIDIQQVFYRMEENVPGAYAQKPIRAISRIIESSSEPGELVCDFFSHSGTTLLAAEMLGRSCYTCDIDPVFAELTIRRLEWYRKSGKTGFQTGNPFPELEI
jgi:site-specific DNA-methyltransferase (adenine-specific)